MTDAPRWIADHDPLPFRTWLQRGGATYGFKVTDVYTEQFWLPVVGPTSLWILRRLQVGDTHYAIPLDALGAAMGVGVGVGVASPVVRSLARLVQFRLARIWDETYEVADVVPPLTERQLARLHPGLQAYHAKFTESWAS